MRKRIVLIILSLIVTGALLFSGCFLLGYKTLRPSIASDGSGGVIIAWEDENVIYAQRVDSNGNLQWRNNLVLSAIKWCGSPEVIEDSSGGAIIVWSEGHEKEAGRIQKSVHAQRINPGGEIIWEKGGRPVQGLHGSPHGVADGTGGAIIVSEEPGHKIRAQRIDLECKPVWSGEAVTICTTASSVSDPAILADGSGGVTVVWQDTRSNPNEIYAQRINPDGITMWQKNGIPINAPYFSQCNIPIVSDGSDGAIVAWLYYKNASGFITGDTLMEDRHQVYAQRFNAEGEPLWGEEGVQINILPVSEGYPLEMISDDEGGAIIVWHPSMYWGEPFQEKFLQGLRVQKVDSQGSPQWSEPARLFVDVNISGKEGISGGMDAGIIGDSSNGAVVLGIFQTWGPAPYAQKLGPDGNLLWTEGGVEVFNNRWARFFREPQIVGDGSGGIIIVADMARDVHYLNRLYAQRIDFQGKCLWGAGGIAVYP